MTVGRVAATDFEVGYRISIFQRVGSGYSEVAGYRKTGQISGFEIGWIPGI